MSVCVYPVYILTELYCTVLYCTTQCEVINATVRVQHIGSRLGSKTKVKFVGLPFKVIHP